MTEAIAFISGMLAGYAFRWWQNWRDMAEDSDDVMDKLRGGDWR